MCIALTKHLYIYTLMAIMVIYFFHVVHVMDKVLMASVCILTVYSWLDNSWSTSAFINDQMPEMVKSAFQHLHILTVNTLLLVFKCGHGTPFIFWDEEFCIRLHLLTYVFRFSRGTVTPGVLGQVQHPCTNHTPGF